MTEHVWYASYGSNLYRKRFMCYIEGGTPEGSTKHHKGCTNRTPPADDRRIIIPHKLYFARNSPSWEGEGVAFIRAERNENVKTLGRMYLINKEQFEQVVRQECGMEPDNDFVKVDFDDAIMHSWSLTHRGWYQRIVYLGEEEGKPIFTFTEMDISKANPPGERYRNIIRKGLKESYRLAEEEIEAYLARAGA